MAFHIGTNVAALNAHNQLTATERRLSRRLERMTTGLRINRAGDDSAGLAVSEKLRAQTTGLRTATDNAQHASAMIATAAGALGDLHAMLQRMRELSVQAGSDHLTSADRDRIQDEIGQLLAHVDHIGDTTRYQDRRLLSGDYASDALTFQIGANAGESIALTIGTVASNDLGVDLSSLNVTTQAGASAALGAIDSALDHVTGQRGTLGAFLNRLAAVVSTNTYSADNSAAAESRVRDVDLVRNMIGMTRESVLRETGLAAMTQANSLPQTVLSLLQ